MTRKKKIAKFGALLGGYSLGIFLNQGVKLLLVPIFWSVLEPQDFGVIAISEIVGLFLAPVYMFGASETIQRFYFKWSEQERPHYLSWFFWFLFGFTLTLTLLLDLLGQYFSKTIIENIGFDPILRMVLWTAFFSNFVNVPIAISRIKQKLFTYNIIMNGSFLTSIGLVFYFVKIQHLGVFGYVSGFFLSSLIWFLPTIFINFLEMPFFPSRKYFKIPLYYAAPLSLAGIIEGISNILDRYFLDKFIPLATIGFYDLARKFASLINIINSISKLIYIPYIYKLNALKSNSAEVLGHSGIIYAVFMIVPFLTVCTLSSELVTIFDSTNRYSEISTYVPYWALSFYFMALAMVIGRGLDLVGNTKWSFVIPLFGLITSVITYNLALPKLGIIGILLGLVIGNFSRHLLNILMAVYYFPRKLYLKKLALSWLLAVPTYFALTQIHTQNVYQTIFIKIMVILALMALLLRGVLFHNIQSILKQAQLNRG